MKDTQTKMGHLMKSIKNPNTFASTFQISFTFCIMKIMRKISFKKHVIKSHKCFC